MRLPDRIGETFGRLEVVGIAEKTTKFCHKNYKQQSRWHCKCSCGNTKIVVNNDLGRRVNSCGCLRKERGRKQLERLRHGKTISCYSA